MANSAFTPAVLTVTGSSSTSSGEKNYVTATDGNASGLWVASGVTVATSTSTIPDNITKASSLAITWTSGTTGYARYRFTLDQADYGKKFKIQWDQVYGTAGHWTLQVYSNTASDYTGTSTALTVQTSAVPGITGTFTTSVDMPGSTAPYIEIRIVASSASATTIYLNSILMGPGTIVQGAVISEWVEFTPTLKGSTSDPSLGTTGQAQYGRYIRIGSNAKIRYNWRFGTTSPSFGSGTYYFLMPTGLTVDTSRLETSSNNNANPIIGHGYVADDSASINYVTEVIWDRANDRLTMLAGSNGVAVTQIAPMTFAAQDSIIIEIEVPIAEWAGSGTVNLGAGAQVEYVATSGTWDADSSTTVYGPSGVALGGSLTADRTKTVTFQYPIQQDDQIILEFSTDGTRWLPQSSATLNSNSIPSKASLTGAGPAAIGARVDVTGSTTAQVVFGRYQIARLDDGTNAANWPSSSAYWRVRKAKASSPVGFGLAGTDGSAGLVNPYSVGSGVVYAGTYTPTITSTAGFTIGTIYAASYLRVGSVVTVSGSFKLATSATTNNVATISLPINRTTASVLTNGGGTAVYARGSVTPLAIPIYTNGSTSSLEMFAYTGSALASDTTSYTFTYSLA